jgi:hypothetical protein
MSRNNVKGRGRLTTPSQFITKDNGSVFISVVDGEQLHFEFVVNWMTNLTGATITAKIVEAVNDGAGTQPTAALVGGQVTDLLVLDEDTTDNEFKIIIPANLVENYAVQPGVDKPVFGFIGLEIADAGETDTQQIWKPLRGMVEVLYSPTEAI